jgi:hypothetical protein
MDMSAEQSSQNSPFTDGIRPQWHPRVPREKIRLLYENDARGLVEETLVDDVGIGLLLRCRSILIATEAHEGRARCPRCAGIIPHQWKKDETMTCSTCDWQTTWGAYFKTYQHKQLHGGGALFAFQAYADTYEQARTYPEKMLLIDRLLTAFHSELSAQYTRPAACNLIGGNLDEVIAFLDELTYGAGKTLGARAGGKSWQEKANHAPWIRNVLLAQRMRRTRDGD